MFKQPYCINKLYKIIAFRAGKSWAGKLRSENWKFQWSSDDYEVRVLHLCYAFKDLSLQTMTRVLVKSFPGLSSLFHGSSIYA
jgi:hypothetical protein